MKTSRTAAPEPPFARELLREPSLALLDRHLPPCFVALDQNRRPVDPAHGFGLSGWQDTRISAQEIWDAGDRFASIGLLTGPPSGLAIFDLDDQEAIALALEHGCDPWAVPTWRTVRLNALDRIKVVFAGALPPFIDLMPTLHLKADVHGVACDFLSGGAQAAVFGRHKSGVTIRWLGSPESIAVMPPEWEAFYHFVLKKKQEEHSNRPSIADITTADKGWYSPAECPICGRPASYDKDCRMRRDGKRVQCRHGKTYKPPDGLRSGEVILGRDEQRWRYHETVERSGSMTGILYSNFSLIETPMTAPIRKPVTPLAELSEEPTTVAVLVATAEPPETVDLLQSFPADLSTALREVSKHLPYEEHAVAMTFLAGASGMVKLGTTICGNPASGFEVPPNLYVATVARSGQMKTPLQQLGIHRPARKALSRVDDINQMIEEKWIEACQEAKAKKLTKPEKPRRVSIHVSDYTGEALDALLSELEPHERGVLIVRDEMSGLLRSMNAYRGGLGADAQQILEIYDGHASNSIRCSSDRTYKRCHVSIHGNIQPEVLRELVKGGDPDGKWARFLFLPLKEMAVRLPDDVNEETMDAIYAARGVLENYIAALYELTPSTYTLDQEARKRFNPFHFAAQEDALDAPSEAHAALISKKAGKVLRIAGLLHILRHLHPHEGPAIPDRIPLDTLNAAIEAVEFFDDWALGFQSVVAQEVKQEKSGGVTALMARIHTIGLKAKGPLPWKKIREQMAGSEKKGVTAQAAERAMEALAKLGVGKISHGPRGGVLYEAIEQL